MSLRQTLFLGITVAVLAVAGLEVFSDVATDRLAMAREGALAARMERAAAEVDARLPEFLGTAAGDAPPLRSEPNARVTVRRTPEDAQGAADGTLEVDAGSGWVRYHGAPADGVALRLALPLGWFDRVAAQPLLLDMLDLPLFVAVAFLTAWLLSRALLGPLRHLTVATEAASQWHLPVRVTVPPGDDELARLARRFNAMIEAIRTQLERERAFTRYASHELRTPLSAFRVQVERAELGLIDPAEVLPALQRNIRRMEQVLDGLLALARAGERDDAPRPLTGVLDDALATLPEEARARVRVDLGSHDQLHVRDGTLLERALQNLLDNALRHGHGPATVRLRVHGDSLVAQVIDLGPGVPESDLVHLTKPFYRRSGDREGVGLGLALVKTIAEGVGGRFELANHGRGLTATLTLPIVAAT